MSMTIAANGRHVVRIERSDPVDIPGAAETLLGTTYYFGLYFHEGEVATCWAVESYQRNPAGGSQRGYTVNLYKDGSTTIMAFEGEKSALDTKDRNRFDGTWRFAAGTGRFERISGGGTYEGETFEGIAYSNVTGTAKKA